MEAAEVDARRAHAQSLRDAEALAQQCLTGSEAACAESKANSAEARGIAQQLKRLVQDVDCCGCQLVFKSSEGVVCGGSGDGLAGNSADSTRTHFLCTDCFSSCVRKQTELAEVAAIAALSSEAGQEDSAVGAQQEPTVGHAAGPSHQSLGSNLHVAAQTGSCSTAGAGGRSKHDVSAVEGGSSL
jgi:hypothetical protein